MGLRELSLEASSIPDVRAGLENITIAEAEAAAQRAEECATAAEVEDLFRDAFGDRVASGAESG